MILDALCGLEMVKGYKPDITQKPPKGISRPLDRVLSEGLNTRIPQKTKNKMTEKLTKTQRIVYVRKNFTTKSRQQLADYFKTSVRTIDRDMEEIRIKDLKKVSKENIVYEIITRLDELRNECRILTSGEGVQDSVKLGAINSESKLLAEKFRVLQEGEMITKAAEKHVVESRGRPLKELLEDMK